jgi:hypothetical protein
VLAVQDVEYTREVAGASSSAGMPSIAWASTPRLLSAASTLRPESSDTSRSAELPPITTATRPNRAGSAMRTGALKPGITVVITRSL